MKKLMILGAVAFCAAGMFAEKVAIKFELPPPHSSGTPKEIKSDNLEPAWSSPSTRRSSPPRTQR